MARNSTKGSFNKLKNEIKKDVIKTVTDAILEGTEIANDNAEVKVNPNKVIVDKINITDLFELDDNALLNEIQRLFDKTGEVASSAIEKSFISAMQIAIQRGIGNIESFKSDIDTYEMSYPQYIKKSQKQIQDYYKNKSSQNVEQPKPILKPTTNTSEDRKQAWKKGREDNNKLNNIIKQWRREDVSKTNERYTAFNSSSLKTSGAHAAAEAEGTAQDLIISAINEMGGDANGFIHSHPNRIAAFSDSDISDSFELLDKGIKTQVTTSFDQAMILNMNAVKKSAKNQVVNKVRKQYGIADEEIGTQFLRNNKRTVQNTANDIFDENLTGNVAIDRLVTKAKERYNEKFDKADINKLKFSTYEKMVEDILDEVFNESQISQQRGTEAYSLVKSHLGQIAELIMNSIGDFDEVKDALHTRYQEILSDVFSDPKYLKKGFDTAVQVVDIADFLNNPSQHIQVNKPKTKPSENTDKSKEIEEQSKQDKLNKLIEKANKVKQEQSQQSTQDAIAAEEKLASTRKQTASSSETLNDVEKAYDENGKIAKKAGNIKQLREQYNLLRMANNDIQVYEDPKNWVNLPNGKKSFNGFGLKKTGSGYEDLKALKKEIIELNPQLAEVEDRVDRIKKADFEEKFEHTFTDFIDKEIGGNIPGEFYDQYEKIINAYQEGHITAKEATESARELREEIEQFNVGNNNTLSEEFQESGQKAESATKQMKNGLTEVDKEIEKTTSDLNILQQQLEKKQEKLKNLESQHKSGFQIESQLPDGSFEYFSPNDDSIFTSKEEAQKYKKTHRIKGKIVEAETIPSDIYSQEQQLQKEIVFLNLQISSLKKQQNNSSTDNVNDSTDDKIIAFNELKNKSKETTEQVNNNLSQQEKQFEQLGSGIMRVLSEIGLSYDEYVAKINSQKRGMDWGERLATVVNGKIQDSIKGTQMQVGWSDDLKIDDSIEKILHLHPNGKGQHEVFSPEDILGYYDKVLSQGYKIPFELLQNGQKTSLDFRGMNRNLIPHVITALSQVDQIVRQNLKQNGGTIKSQYDDQYQQLTNSLFKAIMERYGGRFKTDKDIDSKIDNRFVQDNLKVLEEYTHYIRGDRDGQFHGEDDASSFIFLKNLFNKIKNGEEFLDNEISPELQKLIEKYENIKNDIENLLKIGDIDSVLEAEEKFVDLSNANFAIRKLDGARFEENEKYINSLGDRFQESRMTAYDKSPLFFNQEAFDEDISFINDYRNALQKILDFQDQMTSKEKYDEIINSDEWRDAFQVLGTLESMYPKLEEKRDAIMQKYSFTTYKDAVGEILDSKVSTESPLDLNNKSLEELVELYRQLGTSDGTDEQLNAIADAILQIVQAENKLDASQMQRFVEVMRGLKVTEDDFVPLINEMYSTEEAFNILNGMRGQLQQNNNPLLSKKDAVKQLMEKLDLKNAEAERLFDEQGYKKVGNRYQVEQSAIDELIAARKKLATTTEESASETASDTKQTQKDTEAQHELAVAIKEVGKARSDNPPNGGDNNRPRLPGGSNNNPPNGGDGGDGSDGGDGGDGKNNNRQHHVRKQRYSGTINPDGSRNPRVKQYEYEDEFGQRVRKTLTYNANGTTTESINILTDYEKVVKRVADATVEFQKAQHKLNEEQNKQNPNLQIIYDLNEQLQIAQREYAEATTAAGRYIQAVQHYRNDWDEGSKFTTQDFLNDVNSRVAKAMAKENYKNDKSLNNQFEQRRKKLTSHIGDINFEIDNGKHTQAFISQLTQLRTEMERIASMNPTYVQQADVDRADRLLEDFRIISKSNKLSANKTANENSVLKSVGRINKLLSENTKFNFRNSSIYSDFQSLKKAFETFDTSRPQSELDALNTRLLETMSRFDELSSTVKGKNIFQLIGDHMRSTTAQLVAQYLSFQDVIRYLRQMATTIIDLDTQLVDLRKTTTMTTSELNEFYSSSANIAKQLGVTSSEIISQAAAWSRLGYSSREAATQMAQLSSKFATVSPGMTTEQSTDYLVSTMQAYGIAVDEVERKIMDNVNRIGNTFATTNAEIGEMLTRSSAAMKAANNSLEETIALESAAVEVTRNAEMTGTAFRTISMRIRGLDEETEEALDDYEELKGKIADLTKTDKTPGGVSLFTDASKTEYKSTYQFLKDISKIYNDLTDKEQAELLETIGGKRGAQSLATILSNFDEVERAMAEMEDAAGSADAEMGIVEQSIEFKLNALRQEWVETLTQVSDRGEIGNWIDRLTKVSEALGWVIDKLGLFKTAAIGVAAVWGSQNLGLLKYDTVTGNKDGFLQGLQLGTTGIGSLNANKRILDQGKNKSYLSQLQGMLGHNDFEKHADGLATRMKDVDRSVVQFAKDVNEAGDFTVDLSEAFVKQTSVGETLKSTIKNLGGTLLTSLGNAAVSAGISAIISTTIAGIQAFIESDERLAAETQKIASEFKQQKTQLTEYSGDLIKLRGVMEDSNSTTQEVRDATSQLYTVQNKLYQQYPQYASNIDLVNGNLEDQLKLLRQINQENSQRALNEINSKQSNKVKGENLIFTIAESGINLQKLNADWTAKFFKNLVFEDKGFTQSLSDTFFSGDFFDKDLGTTLVGSSSKQIKDIVEGYQNSFKTSNEEIQRLAENYSDVFTVDGNKITATGNIYDVNDAVVALQLQLEEMGVTDEKVFKELGKIASETSEDITKYGDSYNTIIEGEIQNNGQLAKSYRDLTKIYNEYLEAQASGDTEKVEEIADKYKDTIDQISKSGIESEYFDYFKRLYPEMQQAISEWQFEVQINPAIGDTKGLTEYIQNNSADSIKSLYQHYISNPEDVEDTFGNYLRALETIVASSDGAFKTVYQLIDYLKGVSKYSDEMQYLKELMGSNWKDEYEQEFADMDLTAVLDIKPKPEGLQYTKEEIEKYLNPIEIETNVKAEKAVDSMDSAKTAITSLNDLWNQTVQNSVKLGKDKKYVDENGNVTKQTDAQGQAIGYADPGLINNVETSFKKFSEELAESGDKNGAAKINEALSEFERTLVEFPGDADKAQDAMNKLITAYIDQTDIIKNLTEENAEWSIAQLEAYGITNAESVVMSRLNKNAKDLASQYSKLRDAVTAYNQALANGDEEGQEQGVTDITDRLNDIYGFTSQKGEEVKPFDTDYVMQNLDTINAALEDTSGRFNELDRLASKKYITDLIINSDDSDLQSAYSGLYNFFNNFDGQSIDIGTSMDGSPIYSCLTTILQKTRMTFSEFQAMVSQMSGGTITPKVKYEPLDVEMPMPIIDTASYNNRNASHKQADIGLYMKKKVTYSMPVFEYEYSGKPSTAQYKPPSGGGGGAGGGGGGGNADKGNTSKGKTEHDLETFDWIEKKIQRLEEAIASLDKTVNNSFRNWGERNTALSDEISKVTDEIKKQEHAQRRYANYAKKIKNIDNYKANRMYQVDKKPKKEEYEDNEKQYDYELQQWKDANKTWKTGKYQKLVRNGKIGKKDIEKIDNKYLVNLIDEYQTWYEKSIAAEKAAEDLRIKLAELNKLKFDNLKTQLDEVIEKLQAGYEVIDKRIARTEEYGFFLDEKFYRDQQKIVGDQLDEAVRKRKQLIDQLNYQLGLGKDNGGVDYLSEEWYNMLATINDVNAQTEELRTQLVQLDNQVRQLKWDNFDYLLEKLSDIKTEAEWLTKFLTVNDIYEENGELKNSGWGNVGMIAAQYNASELEAEKYAAEIKRLEDEANASMKTDRNLWNDQKYVARIEELREKWRDAKAGLIEYGEAMKSVVEGAIQKHLEHLQKVINKYKEALSSAKDLYDWQKNITDQTKQIESLEKQLRAVQGDDSESARKRRQELTNQLESAQQQLQETEWDRYISQTGEMLDKLYEDYEEILNARLDDVEALMKDMIIEIQKNGGDVRAGLTAVLTQYGLGNTEHFKEFINGNQSLASVFENGKLANSNTAIATEVETISSNVEKMQETLTNGALAKALQGSVNIVYDKDTGRVSISSAPNDMGVKDPNAKSNPQDPEAYRQGQIDAAKKSLNTAQEKWHKALEALDKYIAENAKKVKNIKNLKNPTEKQLTWLDKYYRKLDTLERNLQNTEKKRYLAEENLERIRVGYATGTRKVPHDQLAWTQEEGSEVIFRKSDGAMLTPLGQGDMVFTNEMSKTLWAIAKGGIPTNANIIVPDISGNRNTTVTANNEITITLPNVQDYASFKHDLQNDDNFEKFIQEVTIGQVWGNNKLNKRKY